MTRKSAGILVYRHQNFKLEFLLVHPGGPVWAKKDLGAWSIPKGEFEDEEPLIAAKREFQEEIGVPLGDEKFILLSPVKQKGGKIVHAWALDKDIDVSKMNSNTFVMQWPPKSGKFQTFPEIDKAEWFSIPAALEKINQGQSPLLHELINILGTIPSD
jgi:predicted NUDIX family NTP pyrophosphohydrolase